MNALKSAAVWAVGPLLCYLSGAFTYVSFDIHDWSLFGRFTCMVFCAVCLTFTAIFKGKLDV